MSENDESIEAVVKRNMPDPTRERDELKEAYENWFTNPVSDEDARRGPRGSAFGENAFRAGVALGEKRERERILSLYQMQPSHLCSSCSLDEDEENAIRAENTRVTLIRRDIEVVPATEIAEAKPAHPLTASINAPHVSAWGCSCGATGEGDPTHDCPLKLTEARVRELIDEALQKAREDPFDQRVTDFCRKIADEQIHQYAIEHNLVEAHERIQALDGLLTALRSDNATAHGDLSRRIQNIEDSFRNEGPVHAIDPEKVEHTTHSLTPEPTSAKERDAVSANDEFNGAALGLWTRVHPPSQYVLAVNRADFMEIVARRECAAELRGERRGLERAKDGPFVDGFTRRFIQGMIDALDGKGEGV